MRWLVLLTLVVCSSAVHGAEPDRAANWPHWRGPNADGVAPKADPPIHWDETTHVKWKAPLAGRGSSSPIVWEDQVFVATAVETDRVATAAELPKAPAGFEKKTTAPTNFYRFEITSFDRASGKIRWKKTATEAVPHEGHHPTHSYAGGSPTTDGRRVYVSFASYGTYCYDLTGKLLWSRDFGRMNSRLGWGEAVTPVVHGDVVLLNHDQEADSALYCLDAATGQTRWKTPRDEKTSWNTPLVVQHAGRTQVILNATQRIRSYDLATGKEIWSCGGMTINAIPSAVAADGVVYVMSGYKGSLAVAVSLDAVGDVTDSDKVLWRHTKGTPYVPSPLLADGRLWFTQENGNLLTTLDVKTGKPVLDRVRLPGLTTFFASPTAAAGRVYFVDQKGTTLVLKQGDKLEVLATNRLNDTIDATPAVAGKDLFLRGEHFLYCIAD
jgi:outer membrane protein assembly factor BamB